MAMADLPPVTRSPWASTRSRVFDIALTAVLLLGVLVMLVGPFSSTAVLLTICQIVPLTLRRVRPSLSFALVAGAMAVQVVLTDLPVWGQVAMPVAVYSVAAYGPRSHARVAFAVALVAGVVGPADWLVAGGLATSIATAVALVTLTELLVVAPWAIGSLARTRRAYVAGLIDRSRRLEVEAAQRAELATVDERARIAREMHDVVAHGLSVMIVQADGASYAVRRDPASAAGALEAIAATGRESLAEMRRMLGLLRSDDVTGSLPQPGLADLSVLLEQSQATGMVLSADIEDPLPSLGPGVELTVYRIVQEGLTNVRKHAGPQPRVSITVCHGQARGAPSVQVEVTDDGRGPSAVDPDGHGLTGMRERVAVHGGSLWTGPRPGGGFTLRAEIPLSHVRSAG
jgi:signal transduction histidine kinase